MARGTHRNQTIDSADSRARKAQVKRAKLKSEEVQVWAANTNQSSAVSRGAQQGMKGKERDQQASDGVVVYNTS